MDTDRGFFEMLTEKQKQAILEANPEQQVKIFHVGEVVKLKQSRFKIVKITPKKMTLRILPKEESGDGPDTA